MSQPPRDHFHLPTTSDVTTMWRTLIRPLGWRNPFLYIVMVDDDRVATRHIVEVDEMPTRLSPEDADQFVRSFATIIGSEGFERIASLALLMCRPGPGLPNSSDRASCDRLYRAARAHGVPLEVIHVGTDTAITPAPMDEVAGAA